MKTPILRAWNTLAPKLVAFLATGLSAAVVIQIAETFGYQLDPALAATISVVVGSIAGYIKKDTVDVQVVHAPRHAAE